MKNFHTLLIAAELAAGSTLRAKQQAPVLLGARDLTPWGGFGILTSTCPSGTTACDSSSCCPNGYKCVDTGSAAPVSICCPDSTDCSANVKALDACADTSWTLYQFGGYFCCDADSVGTYKPDIGRQCIAKKLPVPSSIALTAVPQVTGTGTAAAATNTNGPATTSGSGTGSGSGSGSGPSSSQGTGSVSRPPQSSPTGGNSAGPNSEPASSNNSANNSGSNSALPQSAIIAIAVLSTVVGMLLIFVPWIFCLRRNKRGTSPPSAPVSAPLQHQAAPQGPQELHHQHRYPAPAAWAPAAVPAAHNDISPVATPAAPPTYTTPPPNMSELHNTPYTAPVYETDSAQRNELAAHSGK